VEDQVGHGVAAEERLAEPARSDVDEPAAVLDGQGRAEPEIGHDAHAVFRLHLRVAFDPQDGHQRVPGNHPKDQEDDDGDPDEGPQGEERPPGEVFLHGSGPSLSAFSSGGR
jgi:hypothetical protein